MVQEKLPAEVNSTSAQPNGDSISRQSTRECLAGNSNSVQPNGVSISRQSTRENLPGSDKSRSPRSSGHGVQASGPEAAKGELAVLRPTMCIAATNAPQPSDAQLADMLQQMSRLEVMLGSSIAEVSQILFALMNDCEKENTLDFACPSRVPLALPGATVDTSPSASANASSAPQATMMARGGEAAASAWGSLRSAANPRLGGGAGAQQSVVEPTDPNALRGLDEESPKASAERLPGAPGKARKHGELMKRVQYLQRNLSNGLNEVREVRAARLRSSREHSDPPSSSSNDSTSPGCDFNGPAASGSSQNPGNPSSRIPFSTSLAGGFPSRVSGVAGDVGATCAAERAWPMQPGKARPELLY